MYARDYTSCVYRCIPVLIRLRLIEHLVTNWPACTVDRENPRKTQWTQSGWQLVCLQITFWYNFQNNRISSMMYSLLNVLYGWFQSARIPHDWNSFFCCSNASVANWRAKRMNEVTLNLKMKMTNLPNWRTIRGSWLFELLFFFCNAFNSMGNPWQSQPGRKSIRYPSSSL
jgi:hypothetical protein